VFVALALLQLSSVFALRSEIAPAWRLGLRSNPLLVAAVLGNVTLLLGAVYWPPARAVFHTEPLALADLGAVFLVSLVSFVAVEAAKLVRRRRGAVPADRSGGSASRVRT
jgi:P-type Ca2+ transporter type 2C